MGVGALGAAHPSCCPLPPYPAVHFTLHLYSSRNVHDVQYRVGRVHCFPGEAYLGLETGWTETGQASTLISSFLSCICFSKSSYLLTETTYSSLLLPNTSCIWSFTSLSLAPSMQPNDYYLYFCNLQLQLASV
jgi:hypothetical protein